MGSAAKTKGPKIYIKLTPYKATHFVLVTHPQSTLKVTSKIKSQAVFLAFKLVFIRVQNCENLIKDNHAVLAVMQIEPCDCAKSLHKDLDNVDHQLVGELGWALSVYAGIALAGIHP